MGDDADNPGCTTDPDTGVPYCSTDDCDQYDGKRCMLMGLRPGHICEPAVINLVAKLRRLEAK